MNTFETLVLEALDKLLFEAYHQRIHRDAIPIKDGMKIQKVREIVDIQARIVNALAGEATS